MSATLPAVRQTMGVTGSGPKEGGEGRRGQEEGVIRQDYQQSGGNSSPSTKPRAQREAVNWDL